MLNIPASTRIYVASEPVDIRKGFDALAAWVEANGLDVYSGHVFVFLSRRLTHVKALTWSRAGFVMLYKRLETGRFRFPARAPGARTVTIDATELAMLLDGIDILQVRRSKAWKPVSRGGSTAGCSRGPMRMCPPSPTSTESCPSSTLWSAPWWRPSSRSSGF